MLKTIENSWSDILSFMKEENEMTDISFNTWLLPLKLFKYVKSDTDEKDKLYIIASESEAIVSIVTKKFKDYLGIAIEAVTGIKLTPVFITEAEKDKISEESSERKTAAPPEKRTNLNPDYTFKNFVSGKSNELAHAAALAVAENPGQDYKLLYIYGNSGLGKTHLMHAIAHYILKTRPDTNILYATSEKFTNDYIDSLRDSAQNFRRKYREDPDVLLIDDIQFIASKERTQEEFFHTFNTLYDNNKQIVISSDKPPKDINNLEERIRSRFEGGLIVDIQPPDFETRVAILRKKEERENYNIDDEVIKYIASNIKSNIRILEGALQRVCLKSRLEKIPVNADMAREILKDVIGVSGEGKRLTEDKIIAVTAEHFGLQLRDMSSERKNKEIVMPRQVAMYLCRELTDSSLETIGDKLGGRDHSTVIHGINKIEKDIEKNDALANNIEVIRKKLMP